MDFPRRQRGDGHEPVIPLINVIFLLLIFFLVTGTLRSADLIDVAPPQAASGIAAEEELPSVLVGADGSIAFDGQLLELRDLAAQLVDTLHNRESSHIVVKADGRVRSDVLLSVFDQLGQAGVRELSLVTEFNTGS